jgi:hypothetical protein
MVNWIWVQSKLPQGLAWLERVEDIQGIYAVEDAGQNKGEVIEKESKAAITSFAGRNNK